MAGAGGAVYLVASMQLPTAPTAPIDATASVPGAVQAPQTAITGPAGNYKHPTIRPDVSKNEAAILDEAGTRGGLAMAPFTFAALPTQALNASVIAGDFNVYYPDTYIAYDATARLKLGSSNAYAALTAAAPGGARNTANSTLAKTGYENWRVYSL